jgi:glycosyltransferase involved in cell wall biosynthesis
MNNSYKILWLATHPTQYQTPLLKRLGNDPRIEIKAVFFSDFSTKSYFDTKFKQVLEWDLDLLDGIDYQFIKMGEEKEIGFFKPLLFELKSVIRNSDFDYVFVQGWQHYGMIYAATLAKRYRKKVLNRCEASDHVTSTNNLIKKMIRNYVIKYFFSKIDIFFSIGVKNKKFYLDRGINEDKIGFMPYCVDNEKFNGGLANREAFIEKFGLLSDAPTILFVGKLSDRKNAKLLIEAYQRLRCPRPNLLIVGTGEKENELKQYCVKHKLTNVKFLGFQNQGFLPDIYSFSDVFVLPSVNEPWGLVVNEAMNAGCAIITTAEVGSAHDLVHENYNGIVLKELSVENLTNALTKCLEPDTLNEYKLNSSKLIFNYSFEMNLIGLLAGLSNAR